MMEQNKKVKIAIIGRGRIGKTLQGVFSTNKKVDVVSYDKKLDKKEKLPKVLKDAQFVFLCIPSYEVRKFITSSKKNISPNSVIVVLSKGIEAKTFKLPFEIVQEKLPQNELVVLGGPLMAEEILGKEILIGIIAGSLKNFRKIKKIFNNCKIDARLGYSTDFKSISLNGALKNVYTLLLAASDFKRKGLNYKSFLLVEVFKEMRILVKFLGGDEKTVYGLSGLGDLIATAFSRYSANKKAAYLILKDPTNKNVKSEGLISLKVLFNNKLIRENIDKFGFLQIIYRTFILKKEIYF